MNKTHLEILTNIIGGVESGGQIYGNRKYSAYAMPYANSPDEHTITLGWAQNYGNNARRLCKNIYDKNIVNFRKIDIANIENKLSIDWEKTRWNPSAKELKALINIISSDIGKKCQDELFQENMEVYIDDAKKFGISTIQSQMMYCEIRHLGGKSAAERIFKKITKPYTVDKIFSTLLLDQNDTSNNNQVGDKKYQSRHECCVKWIKKYVNTSSETDNNSNINGGLNMITDIATTNIYNKYINSTGIHYISNSGHDENNRYTGGKAGDQTGDEWNLRSWYSRPWSCVLRYEKDPRVGLCLANLGCAAALNNLVGYDQGQRISYYAHLKASNWDPRKITIACEDDCSSGVSANVIATGYLLDISTLRNISNSLTTYIMRNALKAAGFTVLTDKKYTSGYDYLLPGDILLYDNGHVCTNITKGKFASYSTQSNSTTSSTSSTILKKGSTGQLVKDLQTNLNKLGYSLEIDGSFGSLTYNAVIDFQKKNNLEVDGIVGLQTIDAINNAIKNIPTITHSYSKVQFIKDVQKSIGAVVDGIAGSETLSKVVTISQTKNRNHGSVKALQQYLYAIGYTSVGNADCDFGSKTYKAVKQYQKDNSLTVDGIVGDNTWKKLLM